MGGRTEKSVRQAYCIAIVAFVMLAGAGEARAVLGPVNSNSVVQDGIEYYMQTNKTVYDLGEDVEMSYRVTNLGVEDVTFEFSSGPVESRCDFFVEKEGEAIWDNLGRGASRVVTQFTLSYLESTDFTHLLDMTDIDMPQFIAGNYTVTAALNSLLLAYEDRYVPVSVSITIIPEPATLALLGTGMIGLLTCGKTK